MRAVKPEPKFESEYLQYVQLAVIMELGIFAALKGTVQYTEAL